MLTLVESWHFGAGGVTWVRNLEASEYFRSVQMYFESLDVVGLHISSGGMRGDQGSNPGGVRFFSLCTNVLWKFGRCQNILNFGI